ncbi:MAG TPA: alanine--tRNA ligase [Luteibaculaceae bacterium]|nr:alanine--tRNA ligase [Luteibaculaceae bacterium]
MTSSQIRSAFLDYFASKGHTIVPSAPIVVKNDPTLMFINAGMNPFKDWFLGNEKPKYPRVANSQKCLRVSGKHNDLEEVGVDTYHHTLFEMLGNWSFGDYFKKEAIGWAWDLLTEVYKIDKNRLYVTVFGGDANDGLEPDHEALELWKSFIAEDRILFGSKKDNFWEMGDTGPCGPCTEIHVDIRSDEERAKVDGKSLVNNDHPQVIEVWNNVFMQFNRMASGELRELPAKHVDTGMGFERLCMVLQAKQSNYDTDVFASTLSALEKLSGKTYGRTQSKADIAFRVIADHIRAVSFAIADGQLPSNTGAGYVIRRILRRAVRYGYSFLDLNQPFICELVAVLAHQMGHQFPELVSQQELIRKVIAEEEESFLRTLDSGIKRFEAQTKDMQAGQTIEGQFAFLLYDTFGFPIDLTDLMAREKGIGVDMDGFQKCLEEQKNRSRKATELTTDDWQVVNPGDHTDFVGYDAQSTQVKLLRYRRVSSKGSTFYQLVFDKTPFYPEGGGQIGDSGVLEYQGDKVLIFDTKKENNLITHLSKTLPAELNVLFEATVDTSKRTHTTGNHSATHLLHFALRELLGTHVEQRGSLVNDNYLRFDFSHFEKIKAQDLKKIESRVNELVRQNLRLNEHRQLPIEQAKSMGAMALFGEKYGDVVRVIQFGESVELCGGTHVAATGQIGLFKITSESAVAAGVRRIEAITGLAAEQYISQLEAEIGEVKELVKAQKDLPEAIKQLIEQQQKLAKELEKINKQRAMAWKETALQHATAVGGLQVIAEQLDLPADSIKDVLFALRSEHPNLVAVLGSSQDGKALLSVMVSDDVVAAGRTNANQIIKEIAKEIGGGGGGQPFYATAGGKDISGLSRALSKVKDILAN